MGVGCSPEWKINTDVLSVVRCGSSEPFAANSFKLPTDSPVAFYIYILFLSCMRGENNFLV